MKNMVGGGIYLLSRALPDGLMSSFSGQAIGRFVMPVTLREATSLKSPARGKPRHARIHQNKLSCATVQKKEERRRERLYLDLTGVLHVVDEVKGLFNGLPESDHAVIPQHQNLKRTDNRVWEQHNHLL